MYWVVADTTKVRIFKQITTQTLRGCRTCTLLLIPQRYEFSSKSQLEIKWWKYWRSCCWYHKGTNFQANHNKTKRVNATFWVVADTTKVRIFKQITTECVTSNVDYRLLLIPQRYEFSSKSQRPTEQGGKIISCCWYHKGTNFQANHNRIL